MGKKWLDEFQLRLVKERVYLPLILSRFEKDYKLFEEINLKTKQPYLIMIHRIMDEITSDLSTIRKEMGKSGIHVYEEIMQKEDLHVKYKYQGYHHEANYLLTQVAIECEHLMNFYLKNVQTRDFLKITRDGTLKTE